MKKIIYTLLTLLLCTIGCKKEVDTTFLITETSIGNLNKKSLARDIEVIYPQDSIVKDTVALRFGNGAKKIKVFEKNGAHILTLTPSSDSIPTIENVNIFDARFKTEKGIGISSTFKDIKSKYTIKKIQTSLNNIVVFVKNSNLYFTIDKKELPANIRYNSSAKIEEVHIPDAAKIKYMMIGWENY